MHLPRHGYVLRRILAGGSRADWSQFLGDTWDPACRFARGYGRLAWPEAREIAVSTFETLVHHDLLQRWAYDPAPELRKLMSTAACDAIAARLSAGSGDSSAPFRTVTPMEEFFTAWTDQIHCVALDRVQAQYYRAGQGNDFRMLYGQVCQGMSAGEVARTLRCAVDDVTGRVGAARREYWRCLRDTVGEYVARYCPTPELQFEEEWNALNVHLTKRGGWDIVLRNAVLTAPPCDEPFSRDTRTALSRLLELLAPRV